MSVKVKYLEAVREEKRVRKIVEKKKKKLEKLKKKYNKLLMVFFRCSLMLSRKKLSLVCKKIENEIWELETFIKLLNRKLERCKKRRMVEENPSEYINEQTSFMVEKLKEFVFKNEEILIIKEKIPMLIVQKERYYNDFVEISDWVPTGIVMIKCESLKIAESKDFFFRCKLFYEYVDNSLPIAIMKVAHTSWFENYIQLFYEALREKIEETFKEHPNFGVKFTDMTHFTLELR